MNININVGGGMGGGFVQEPVFSQVAVGRGIDQNEYTTIINCCKQVYMQRQNPMSTNAGKLIKQYLGAAWLIICSNVNTKNYDFSLTAVEGGDYLSFTLDNILFQVCKIDKF